MQKKYVEEIAKLKEKVHKWQKKHQDMKRTIAMMSQKKEQDFENIKLTFLTKKGKLVAIINELRQKINNISRSTDIELQTKEAIVNRLTKQVDELKNEIVKGKEILMSTNYTIRARRNFNDLVDKNNDEKMIKDDGYIQDIMQNDIKKQ